jgi:hypothetical protein
MVMCAMCWAKNGELLTKNDQVLSRWKEHFEQHLNDEEERDQPPEQVDLRDDGVEFRVCRALKKLKGR